MISRSMKNTKHIFLATLLILSGVLPSAGQQGMLTAWFVDGYHGGIYGHYPKNWYTKMNELFKSKM